MPAYYVTTTVDMGARSIKVEMRVNADTKEDAGKQAMETATLRFSTILKKEAASMTTTSVKEAK